MRTLVVQGVGGADANAVDARLLSPLHLAALYNRPDVARVLLMCGASRRLVGGMTRAAAARAGKLWSPLEMAEEACTEGGELDEGRAVFFFLCFSPPFVLCATFFLNIAIKQQPSVVQKLVEALSRGIIFTATKR